MTLTIPLDKIDDTLAAMLKEELGKTSIPIALIHEERADFLYAEVITPSRHSSLKMPIPQNWLTSLAHRRKLRKAARLFRNHVRRHLKPE